MICSVKQSVITPTINGSDTIFRRKNPSTIQRSLILPSLNGSKSSNPVLSMSKPLHVSRVESFALSKPQKRSLITCKAYEADRSEPIEAPEVKSEAAKKVKIGIYFATWWALNVVFNIYNKKRIGIKFLLGEAFPSSVYLSLVPIIGGCAWLLLLSSTSTWLVLWHESMACSHEWLVRIKMGSLTADVGSGWQTALSEIGPHFVCVGNTMKRISVIVSSIIIFHTPVQPVNALGAAIAVLGTFLYSQMPNEKLKMLSEGMRCIDYHGAHESKAVIAPDLANFMTHVMYDERTSMSTAGDLQIRVAVCQ
uniref:Sugar phosphate transporter domain-containing protein n=1 Tax=Salix viminalis TaxID=40686 RepID=A0A6N2KBJ2_SALVM